MKCQSLISGKNKEDISNCFLLKFVPSMLSNNPLSCLSSPPQVPRLISNVIKSNKRLKSTIYTNNLQFHFFFHKNFFALLSQLFRVGQ